MSILIIGATGTLGSQIVKHALNNGYEVRCLVRNLKKSRFLRDWGANLIKADLCEPETLINPLKGIKYVIDASTSRLNNLESFDKVDFEGKKNLISMAEKAKIKHFIFYSFPNVENYSSIPIINRKIKIESALKDANFSYTIFRLPGFYQGLIGQYGIPILENNVVLSTEEDTSISYIDAEDIAKISIKSLMLKTARNRVFEISGPKKWASREIIKICENLSGQKAKIQKFPIIIIILVKNITCFFEWLWPIANRLLFIEILAKPSFLINGNTNFEQIFSIEKNDLSPLNVFFKDYFQKILRDLRQINFKKSKTILF